MCLTYDHKSTALSKRLPQHKLMTAQKKVSDSWQLGNMRTLHVKQYNDDGVCYIQNDSQEVSNG